MKKLYISIFIFLICANISFAQTILGSFPQLANQTISLGGFKGVKIYPISSSHIDAQGNFKLTYSKEDFGMGYLLSADQKFFFVVLSGEDIEIVGETFSNSKTIKVVKGKENQWLEKFTLEHSNREQAMSAWLFLENLYTSNAMFSQRQSQKNKIKKEIQRVNREEKDFLSSLPKVTYVSWLLPVRKFLSSMSNVVQNRPAEIDATIGALRMLDYSDSRLYKSGFFREAIENHFWLIENSGRSLDSVYIEMQISIDAILKHLVKDEIKLNEVTDYLFKLFEQKSQFKASAYLAIKVLNETSCTINSDLARQLESYRAMIVGNTAADFDFNENTIAPGYKAGSAPKKLSDIQSPFTAVVFGASWCPNCTEELPKITQFYEKWKAKGFEVVFISLDIDKESYQQFVKPFPFISTCDFKMWDGAIANNYYVFATPTIFLLNKNRQIIARPNNVAQLDVWVDQQQ